MRDRVLILAGLATFLVLATVPVWYNLAAGTAARPPETARPAQATACVASRDWMRTSHMDLLMDWRAAAVRHQERTFVTADGRTYAKSLTATCLECHASRAEFCDRCHAYAGVTAYCWDCHVGGARDRTVARAQP